MTDATIKSAAAELLDADLTVTELAAALPSLISAGVREAISRSQTAPALTYTTGTVETVLSTTALVQLDEDAPGDFTTALIRSPVSAGDRVDVLLSPSGGATIVGSSGVTAGGAGGAVGLIDYAYLPGRSGGQQLYGGTDAADSLILSPSSTVGTGPVQVTGPLLGTIAAFTGPVEATGLTPLGISFIGNTFGAGSQLADTIDLRTTRGDNLDPTLSTMAAHMHDGDTLGGMHIGATSDTDYCDVAQIYNRARGDYWGIPSSVSGATSSATTDKYTSAGHPFVNGDEVIVLGSTDPNVVDGTHYIVLNVVGADFQLATPAAPTVPLTLSVSNSGLVVSTGSFGNAWEFWNIEDGSAYKRKTVEIADTGNLIGYYGANIFGDTTLAKLGVLGASIFTGAVNVRNPLAPGEAVNLAYFNAHTGGTATQYINVMDYGAQADFLPPLQRVLLPIGASIFTKTAHGLLVNDEVVLSGVTQKTGVTNGISYWVSALGFGANSFRLKTAPLSGGSEVTTTDITTSGTVTGQRIAATAHPFVNGQKVKFTGITATTGIVNNVYYYVVGVTDQTPNSFTVSPTLNGTAVTLTGSDTISVKGDDEDIVVKNLPTNPHNAANITANNTAFAAAWAVARAAHKSLYIPGGFYGIEPDATTKIALGTNNTDAGIVGDDRFTVLYFIDPGGDGTCISQSITAVETATTEGYWQHGNYTTPSITGLRIIGQYAGAGSVGLRIGPVVGGYYDVAVSGFSGTGGANGVTGLTGAIGILMQNTDNDANLNRWTEECTFGPNTSVVACQNGVVVDKNDGSTSFGYNNFEHLFVGIGPGGTAFRVTNGAWLYNCTMIMKGNVTGTIFTVDNASRFTGEVALHVEQVLLGSPMVSISVSADSAWLTSGLIDFASISSLSCKTDIQTEAFHHSGMLLAMGIPDITGWDAANNWNIQTAHTFRTPGDQTQFYLPGSRLRWAEGGTPKKNKVLSAAYDSGTGKTDVTLISSTVSNNSDPLDTGLNAPDYASQKISRIQPTINIEMPANKDVNVIGTVTRAVSMRSYGVAPAITLQRSSGSKAAPAVAVADDILGSFQFASVNSFTGTAITTKTAAMVRAFATDTWVAGVRTPAQLEFRNTPPGMDATVRSAMLYGRAFVVSSIVGPNAPATSFPMRKANIALSKRGTAVIREVLLADSFDSLGCTDAEQTGFAAAYETMMCRHFNLGGRSSGFMNVRMKSVDNATDVGVKWDTITGTPVQRGPSFSSTSLTATSTTRSSSANGTTNGTTTVTTGTSYFIDADVGRKITGGTIAAGTYIMSVAADGLSAVLSTSPSAGSGITFTVQGQYAKVNRGADGFTVYYTQSASVAGTLTVAIDGVVVGTLNTLDASIATPSGFLLADPVYFPNPNGYGAMTVKVTCSAGTSQLDGGYLHIRNGTTGYRLLRFSRPGWRMNGNATLTSPETRGHLYGATAGGDWIDGANPDALLAIRKIAPEIVTIALGANDANQDPGGVGTGGSVETVAQFKTNLDNMITAIERQYTARVTPLPRPTIRYIFQWECNISPTTTGGDPEDWLTQYRPAALEVCVARDVQFIDMHEALGSVRTTNDVFSLTTDHIHPGDEACYTLAQLLAEKTIPRYPRGDQPLRLDGVRANNQFSTATGGDINIYQQNTTLNFGYYRGAGTGAPIISGYGTAIKPIGSGDILAATSFGGRKDVNGSGVDLWAITAQMRARASADWTLTNFPTRLEWQTTLTTVPAVRMILDSDGTLYGGGATIGSSTWSISPAGIASFSSAPTGVFDIAHTASNLINVVPGGIIPSLRMYGQVTPLRLERVNGTSGTPSTIIAADEIARLTFGGASSVSGTTATIIAGARILATATQSWNGTLGGTKLELQVNRATGGLHLPETSVTLNDDGTVTFASDVSLASLTATGYTTLAGTIITPPSGILTNYTAYGILQGFAGVPGWAFQRANNTAGSPTAIASADVIGGLFFRGYGSGGYNLGGQIIARATQAWNGSNFGTALDFYISDDTASTMVAAMTLDQDRKTYLWGAGYIETRLDVNGPGSFNGALAMSTFKITGVGDPSNPQDVVTKSYGDANYTPGVSGVANTGWSSVLDTWQSLSATQIQITPASGTASQVAKFPVGTRISVTVASNAGTVGGTVVYGTVISTSYFAPFTYLNLAPNNGYAFAGSVAITSPLYSYAVRPQGYPYWFTWTPTFTGFTTAPTGIHRFRIVGSECLLMVAETNGTGIVAGGTVFTMTAPVANSVANPIYVPCRVVNGGTAASTNGAAILAASTAAITLSTNYTTTGAWTASTAAKGVTFQMAYPI